MNQKSLPLLIVISAPSGGGKTTLCNGLLASDPNVKRAITCTTRAPRPGEQQGVDYHFLSLDEFERRIAAGEFLESAQVHGHRYGTLKSEALNRLSQGHDVLLNIDVQGAAAIRQAAINQAELKQALVSVFVTPPSLEVLEQRLKKRNQDSPAVIARRLEAARREIAEWRNFDYLIVSGSIEEDLTRMQSILAAERLRPSRVPPLEI